VETKLIKIGNSQGIRLPKAVIEQAGLTHQLELKVAEGAVIIRSAKRTREGWEDAAAQCHAASGDKLDEWNITLGDFHGEWEWK
jgi:antitoxin MazE